MIMALAALPGCGASGYLPSFQADPGRTLSQPGLPLPSAAATPAGDPIAVFAATAVPGQAGVVAGQSARLSRVYQAGSGRECREVLLGGGMAERSQVACRQPDGSFASTRPLLQGGSPSGISGF
jgi:hypothetical protein